MCLYGTHQATGVQILPKSFIMVNYVKRDKPVISPGAISGRLLWFMQSRIQVRLEKKPHHRDEYDK
jgi:hypothetical protein